MKQRQRHTLRRTSAERGKSNFDAGYEEEIINSLDLDNKLDVWRKIMIDYAKGAGPIWDWLTGIKGLGAGGEAAKLVALIDDIDRFDTIAKLWRHAGYGLYPYWHEKSKAVAPKDGFQWRGEGEDREMVFVAAEPKDGWELKTVRDRLIAGWVSPYNKTLKSLLHMIASQFIRQQTPGYADLYYVEKERQRTLHPEPVKRNGRTSYTDGHIHYRAMRKVIKEFLKDLWVQWRIYEDLPVSDEFEAKRRV